MSQNTIVFKTKVYFLRAEIFVQRVVEDVICKQRV